MLFFRLTDSSLTTFGNYSTLPGNNSLNLSKGQANVCISHKYNLINLILKIRQNLKDIKLDLSETRQAKRYAENTYDTAVFQG